MEQQIAVARADERWVVVGIVVPPIVGTGWEGMALGARGRWQCPGRQRGLLPRGERAIERCHRWQRHEEPEVCAVAHHFYPLCTNSYAGDV